MRASNRIIHPSELLPSGDGHVHQLHPRVARPEMARRAFVVAAAVDEAHLVGVPVRAVVLAVLLIDTKLPGNVREVWVPKGKLLAGPIATLLKQDTSIFPLGTITHITRKF